MLPYSVTGFSGGSDSKESACNAEDLGLNPGLERSPGGGRGYPLPYSCLENPVYKGEWQATVQRIAESDMTEVTSHPRRQSKKGDLHMI